MTEEWKDALERETTAFFLAGGNVCPIYSLPAWVCSTLHLITGVLRTVTHGRFERIDSHFELDSDESGIYRPWIASYHCCPHHPAAPGLTYWATAAASTLDPDEQRNHGGP